MRLCIYNVPPINHNNLSIMPNLKCDQPQSFLTKTRELLVASDLTIAEIHVATGLPFYWIRQVRSLDYRQSPSVNRVQTLYEFLTGAPLFEVADDES